MDAVEEIKARLAIEDVISEYVQLKRAGRNYKGLSPFSNEKTPSFIVSPEKQIWHDFSSGKGGNMFSFVMEMEGLDFKGALEHLARKAGIDLSQYRSGTNAQTGKIKERLYQILDLAAKFYQVQFSKNQMTIDYVFKKRKFSRETTLAFRLGYSPNTGTALVNFLKTKNFTEDEMQKAGLISRRYNGAADMFRGRLMVPLMDVQGKVIGFTARLLIDEPNAPKYINTPQTLLYDKSRHVFGLNLAKEAIRQNNFVVAVEGNLDVIASHQAGVKNVVATAGTAMTEMHLKTLNRFAHDVRLAFDQDQAGQAATERAIPLASKVGINLSVISIPSGKDPDELIQKDPKLWEQAIKSQQYALDWLIDRYVAQLDINSAEGKRRFSDAILPVVRKLEDSVEQDHYINKLAELIGVSVDALRSKLTGTKEETTRLKNRKTEMIEVTDQAESIKLQDHLMSLLLMQPALRFYLKTLDQDMFISDSAQSLLAFLRTNPDFKEDAKTAKELLPLGDYVKILGLVYEELYQDLELLELRNEAARLQARLVEHYVKAKKQVLVHAMRNSTEKEQPALLKQAKELDQLLKTHKGG